MSYSPLFSAKELLSQGDRTFSYLDTSVLLPDQKGDLEADFASARLPGARRFVLDHFSDNATALPHMVPSAGEFSQALTALGIGNDDVIVVYDRQGSVGACRAWWMLRLFGHERIHILDGGLEAYRKEGGALVSGAPQTPSPAIQPYRTHPHYTMLAGLGDVETALGQDEFRILDARSPARFRGETPEPRPGVRGGHMPGAVNLPYADLVDADGLFFSKEALRHRFAQAEAEAVERRVITSCGSGLTAATLTVGLAVAGLPIGQLYDGSWAEWGADLSTPVVTG
ncbi:sulfurtransferase [Kozakia baliensis]|uniref:sulfurtransferase n=1 Tax=Kozakia baliensis TaxID=153496 RepID=UPI0004961CF2|nr:sulfurtransferase [Kozakia baliensis]